MYSNKTEARFKGFYKGQNGFFYFPKLKTLIVGKIDEDYCLKGRVVHNGVTQKDIDEGRYFAAWNVGYRYNNWDKWEAQYVGKLVHHVTYKGYIDYITNPEIGLEEIKAFQAASVLIKDGI